MISKYTRTLENGRKIDVFMAYDEHPEVFVVYMSNEPKFESIPETTKGVNEDVGSALTDFLEESKNLEEFENGTTFAVKISKGKGFVL